MRDALTSFFWREVLPLDSHILDFLGTLQPPAGKNAAHACKNIAPVGDDAAPAGYRGAPAGNNTAKGTCYATIQHVLAAL